MQVSATTQCYDFTLLLDVPVPEQDMLEDTVFTAGCDDALLAFNRQTPYLMFSRESASAEQAIDSAIAQLQQAGLSVRSIQEGGVVTISGAAQLSGINKTTLDNYEKGLRQTSPFPAPLYGIQTGSRLYSWLDIARWLVVNNKADDDLLAVAIVATQRELQRQNVA